jgi:exodeoxyribonuclease V gamma subunit
MLQLHRAERADRLVAVLGSVLAAPAGGGGVPADPFRPELVAVHSRGIERWLAQELSSRLGTAPGRGDGVCANVDFPFPWQVLGRILGATQGLDPDTDPWSPPRLVWPLLEVVNDHLDAEWLGPLRSHLGDGSEDGTRRGRRFTAVRHVADLFDRYAVHRPGMIQAWAGGRAVDGTGGAVPDDARWQFELWRRLRDRLDVPSLAERLDEAVAALTAGFRVPDLPPRLSLFGLTALPASYVDVLAALGTSYDVHLFLLHPSPVLWERVAGALAQGLPARPLPREQDVTRGLAQHPVLASWGRDAREMQVVLAGAPATVTHHPPAKAAGRSAGPAESLLARLQAGVRDDVAPPGRRAEAQPLELALGDRSVQVHACHGRTRQVEVLRDALLHLLAADPDLEPRDVVVMCPDIETFAPIIQAVFGAAVEAGAGAGGLPDLRVRLADRALRQTNPLLRVVADLLALADGRLTASDVLDLAGRAPVRRRFRLDDDDLQRLEEWVVAAGVRWGLHADHRASFGLDGIAANTWRAGLDRILLGIAMADEDDRLVAGAVPLDDVEGGDLDLAGRLAELVDRLDDAVAQLGRDQPIAAWADTIADVADSLAATAEHEQWQRLQLDRVLGEVREQALAAAAGEVRSCPLPLTLAEVRSLLEDRLAGRPSRANHRTGDLTVCTLVPMRSVPHKVVCLLGMDDAAFPRRVVGDGDDLIDREPCVGDRDARTEDRQLLLDALLAAERGLIITYTGRDERTNERLPPAVPIGELLDCIDEIARLPDGTPASARVLVEHPLQATDEGNFRAGGLAGPDVPWGFDPVALAGARARAGGQVSRPPFLAQPLPPLVADTVDLDELVRFFEHPAKAFLRARLGVVMPGAADEPQDAIPVELSPLEEHHVGEGLLAARLAGVDADRWKAAERARGVLPPGALAGPALAAVEASCGVLVDAAGALCDLAAERQPCDVAVALPDGRTLTGTVAGMCGDVVLAVRYSRVRARQRLGAWIRLLAATAAQPERALRAVTVGRHQSSGSRQPGMSVCLPALGASPDERRRRAVEALAALVDLRDRGLRAPLPLPCRTALAYAEALQAGKDGVGEAEKAWVTPWIYPKEDRDPEHRLVYGDVVTFDALLAERPWDDEAGPGWEAEEPTRFGRCARRLWDPLLEVEEHAAW